MLNQKKSVNKPFLENVSMWGDQGSIFRPFNHQLLTFFKRIFPDKVKLEANRKTKLILAESGGMLSRKVYENLRIIVMGILALCEQFVTQILFFCP